MGDKHNAARFHNNLGLLYFEHSQPAQAQEHLSKAMELFESRGDDLGMQKVEVELKRTK